MNTQIRKLIGIACSLVCMSAAQAAEQTPILRSAGPLSPVGSATVVNVLGTKFQVSEVTRWIVDGLQVNPNVAGFKESLATGSSQVQLFSDRTLGEIKTVKIDTRTPYVPGSTPVVIVDTVASVQPAVARMVVGNTTVDYTEALVGQPTFQPSVGQTIRVEGVQPQPGLPLMAARVTNVAPALNVAVEAADTASTTSSSAFIRAESARGISGSGVISAGISGSGVISTGISGSGRKLEARPLSLGISGSGAISTGISGSGVISTGISGSGRKEASRPISLGISGSGAVSTGISGSGAISTGISGSGRKVVTRPPALGISGSGVVSTGISGSGAIAGGISGSGRKASSHPVTSLGISGSGAVSLGISGSGVQQAQHQAAALGISGSGAISTGISGSGR